MQDAADRLREIEQRMYRELPSALQEVQQLVRLVSQSNEAPAAESCGQIARLAHKMRGRAGILQLQPLADAAAALEELCGRMPDAAKLRDAARACECALELTAPQA